MPETLSACQALIASSEDLQSLTPGYQYRMIYTEQASIKQRWLLVFSQEAYQREVKTLRKTYQKRSLAEYKSLFEAQQAVLRL